jgi:hypothetical protein
MATVSSVTSNNVNERRGKNNEEKVTPIFARYFSSILPLFVRTKGIIAGDGTESVCSVLFLLRFRVSWTLLSNTASSTSFL